MDLFRGHTKWVRGHSWTFLLIWNVEYNTIIQLNTISLSVLEKVLLQEESNKMKVLRKEISQLFWNIVFLTSIQFSSNRLKGDSLVNVLMTQVIEHSN